MNKSYHKAVELLFVASSENGFLASVHDIANYNRIWARDGVICGLAGLLDGDEKFYKIFKNTLVTLANHQHSSGAIPSNVSFGNNVEVSYGGLAGRVDTVSWFIIGVCNYVHFTNDFDLFKQLKPNIEKGLFVLDAWEFNGNHLMYVPRSGNWVDEYITEGHIFYDQLLRLWALRAYNLLKLSEELSNKIKQITDKLITNYKKDDAQLKNDYYHPRAYQELDLYKYWMASITPSGYQVMFDAFANSLALLLNLEDNFNNQVIQYSENLRKTLSLQLLPAFWHVIDEQDDNWNLLKHNNKYEFRNYPYEFHNGGTWQMVNGFYAASIVDKNNNAANEVLEYIQKLNAVKNHSFYECFNSKTGETVGVPNCTWSAAGEIIASQYLRGKKLLL
ncbi:glycoside hydrolase 100 family protein [Tenacibaculum geojense]|uniref:beta-fructofuranosidase n=1 Tax=Tenacibaculum geojense TaxID=915352 RepID=A0ABW3JXD3_9FLAO